MITEIKIQNYKSIWDAAIKLSPFTILIGANGSGKSNFLELLTDISKAFKSGYQQPKNKQHVNCQDVQSLVDIQYDNCPDHYDYGLYEIPIRAYDFDSNTLENISVFSLDPANAGKPEVVTLNPIVHEDGTGTVQVLDSLKTGDREDLFNTIESKLKEFIGDIEKLSFIPEENAKRLQVRDKHLETPIPVSQLSEGTQLTLIILTILHQENPPSIVCIEEIDRGLHPYLYGKIIDLCFELTAGQNSFQIIATSHNPYIIDQFKDYEDAVVIVEKKEGNTIFTSLHERISDLDIDEVPLGELWCSGLIGGVPENE